MIFFILICFLVRRYFLVSKILGRGPCCFPKLTGSSSFLTLLYYYYVCPHTFLRRATDDAKISVFLQSTIGLLWYWQLATHMKNLLLAHESASDQLMILLGTIKSITTSWYIEHRVGRYNFSCDKM